MIAYFDSSALVKLLIEESGSNDAANVWDGADAIVSSRIAYTEVRAALAAANRGGRLNKRQLSKAKDDWERYWATVRAIELGPHLDHSAGDLAEAHGLRGFDAIHVASATRIHTTDVVIATWDTRIYLAAQSMGYATVPARL